MNVETVETVEREDVVDAADADQIMKDWSATGWRFSRGSTAGSFTTKDPITPSSNFAVVNEKGQSRVKMTVEGSTGDPVRTFKNETGYLSPTKATYKTTFGATGGSSIHGEGWYWFKLDRDNSNGFAVVFDNHTACGPFSAANYALYLVKMTNNAYSVVDGTATTITPFDNSPEYNVTVNEVDNVADITISCSNSAATLNGSANTSVTWRNINVKVDGDTTQAFAMFCYGGSYFANCSTSAEATVVKSFGDIVYEPSWTDGALHMLINMDTKSDPTMLGVKKA